MEFEEEETGITELIQAGNCEPKAKKRRVGESDSGNVTVSSIEDSFSVEGSVETQVKVEIHGQFAETLVVVSGLGGNLMGNVCVDDGLNEKVLVGENLKETVFPEVNFSENCCLDGNLRGNGSIEEPEKKENEVNGDVVYVEGTQIKEVGGDEGLKKIESLCVSEETQVKGCGDLNEHEPGDSPLVRDVGIQSEDRGFVGESMAYICGVLESTPTKDCNSTENYSRVAGIDDESVLDSRDKEVQKRKKRRVTFGNTNSTEIVLRRSSRRISSLSSLNHVTRVHESSTVNISNHVRRVDEPSAVNLLSHEISVVSGPEGYNAQSCLPPKVDLPPSSRNVILDEIPILDVFSIYSILRSFSTILFLSPFNLEAFVAALKYKFPNSLIDSIHVSILQTLKLNLEFLSDEGSQSASNCLRSLNWGLLDLITWPVYMVEYLLIHGPELKPGFELSSLKLLNGDYYKQPPTTKVEILRCLCDDLIEAEVIRLELNRRTLASDLDVDVDRNPNVEMYKKRKHPIDESDDSCLNQEIVDKTTDWNSDECCLCKMDGNLICCDGCPAAYHSRCVGIAKDLLPEGDWYCPECMIDKNNPCMKLAMSLRGAEVLGTDPYGRVYFSSCGYLLVSDSCETDSSYYYYHKDDLTIVIDVLKSSHIRYNEVTSAISMNWGIPIGSGPKGLLESQIPNVETDLDVEGQVSANGLSSTPVPVLRMDGAKRGTRKTSQSIRSDSATGSPFTEMAGATAFASSKGPTDFLQVTGIQKSTDNGANSSNKSSGISNEYETPENTNCHASQCSKLNGSNVKQKKNIVSADPVHTLSVLNSSADLSYWQFKPDYYVNYYSFAQVAASVAEELTCKSSNIINDDSKSSAEELITAQMKAISKKWIRVCWSNSERQRKDAEKESCGWCFYCKNPTDSEACMFNMTDKKPSSVGSVEVGSSKRNKNSHLMAIINYILSIEERLSGLLSGPWHNPHYRKHWRKSVLKASNVASLKHQLLSLESNLHRLALSSEWLKPVDSVVTMGSASHILTKGQTSSSKHGGSRKRAKSHTESNSTTNASARPGILWWRGGRVSRQVFHCKVLPHSLVFKGGRQAGCGKIATLLYPDNSEFVRRSKYIAWRAAVEMSTSIPQLACQVRELDLNLRWDDLENTQLFSQLAQESIKLMRPFKKVSVRRKCIEGTHVKYLLDFGKRKTIPEVVIQHGVMLEVSASERKKYWLDESHVPLHLLKAFEEKKVARVANKTAPGVLREEAGKLMKKATRKQGLSHLLSKSENYQCGQCNKDVPVREAVSCTDCKGFFHKKHFRTTKGTINSECTYTCHKCQNKVHIHVKKPLKTKKKRGRPPLPQKKKISILVPVPGCGRGRGRPKGSLKKGSHISLQSRKLAGIKKQEQVQTTKGASKKVIGSQKGKRTRVYHAFWLNGLLLTRKPNDARGMHFRETKLRLPSEDSNAVCTQPICCLCPEAGYTSRLIYVGCEICQEWFHGDAFGLTLENSANLLGFRCHKCRNRKPPLCPHLVGLAVSRSIYKPQLSEEKNNAGNESVKEMPSDLDKSSTEKDEHRLSPNEASSLHKNHKPYELPDSNHKHDKDDTFPFSDSTAMFMECETESGKGLESVHQEQKADNVLDSNQIPVLGV